MTGEAATRKPQRQRGRIVAVVLVGLLLLVAVAAVW